MQIQVRDESGWTHAVVDDGRYAEMSSFIRGNRAIFTSGGGGSQWGRGSAKDAGEAESFSIGQLTYLEQKAFARWYQPMRYEEILQGCLDYSAGPAAKAIDYLVTDQVGIGRRMSPGSNDVPMVDLAYAKITIPVQSGGIGYDYTQEDLRTSAFLRQPLPDTKQVQSIVAYKRHLNLVALQGETPSNLKGLYTNTSVTAANRASGAIWNAATADTIVADIIDAYSNFRTGTGGNEVPTKIVFPLSTRNLLYKPRSTVSDTTIQKFIEDTLKVTIHDDIALETLGAGATKRVVFLNSSNDNIVFHIPMPLQFLAPQLHGYRVVVPAEYKYGGLEIRRIQTVRYMDGV
jgi:hypothetical protein